MSVINRLTVSLTEIAIGILFVVFSEYSAGCVKLII